MKRRNVQLAFVGEGITGREDVQSLTEGDEAVDVEVKGGKLMVVVPAGTPDDRIYERASVLGGELVLENGVRLSFEIKDGAEGAQFNTISAKEEDIHEGLSSLPDVPGGV